MYVKNEVKCNHSVFIVALLVPTRISIEEVKSTAVKVTRVRQISWRVYVDYVSRSVE